MTLARRAAPCVLLFVLALALYRSNGYESSSGDTVATSLLAFNVLEYHRLDLDRFAQTYAKAPGMSYAFYRSPMTGQLTSAFPIGTAILTFPLYAGFAAIAKARGVPLDAASLAFEPQRLYDEKLAASIVAALSVALFFLCVRLFVRPLPAWISTLAYGFGTGVWTVNSQNLYQHGPSNALIIALIGSLAAASRAERRRAVWLIAAGLCAGFVLVVRPTNIFYALAAAIFVVWRFPKDAPQFLVCAALGLAPGIAWDVHFFGRPVGGYPTQTAPYVWNARFFVASLAGLLVSPNRGLFVFSPVLLGAFVGAFRLRQAAGEDRRLLALMTGGMVALVCSYAFFNMWWGGFAYGPRFLLDTLPVLCLLLALALPNTVLSVLLGLSILNQAVGAYGGAASSSWDSVPVSVDEHHERIWQLGDSQIARSARATWYVIAGNPTRSSQYRSAFRGEVTRIDSVPLPVLGKIEVRAAVLNTGGSRWYGYDSGVYLGQARVETSVLDAKRQVVARGYLYILGDAAPGERSSALGDFRVPDPAARYSFETNVVPL
jgi:MFS family permease